MLRRPKDALRPVTRETLGESLVPTMIEDMRAGVWTDTMPGIRTLMRRYQVSRPPVEQALAHLEKLGHVGPPAAGRGRTILSKVSRFTNTRLVLVRAPRAKMVDITYRVYLAIEQELHGRRYEEIVIDGSSLPPGPVTPASGEIVIPIGLDMRGELMRHLFPQPTPLLLLGGTRPDDRCLMMALNIWQVIEEIVFQLLSTRCREVSLIELGLPAGVPNKFAVSVERGYRRAGKPYDAAVHSPVIHRSETTAAIRHVASLPRIDLLLTVRPDVWARVMGVMQASANPKPVRSVLDSPLFHLFDEPQAFVDLNIDDFVRSTARWIRSVERGEPAFGNRQPRYELRL